MNKVFEKFVLEKQKIGVKKVDPNVYPNYSNVGNGIRLGTGGDCLDCPARVTKKTEINNDAVF